MYLITILIIEFIFEFDYLLEYLNKSLKVITLDIRIITLLQ